MNNELESVWKEEVVAYFKELLYRHLRRGLRKPRKPSVRIVGVQVEI
jgi:hypothetical protein